MPPRQSTPRRRIQGKNKLTPEAEAELAKQGIPPAGSASDADYPVYDPDNPAAQAYFADSSLPDGENIYGPLFAEPSIQGTQTGPEIPRPAIAQPPADKLIDAAIEPPDRPLIDPDKPVRETIKTGPPSGDEWLDFFSRIVLKVGIGLYTDFVFRDIDENLISEADIRRITMKKTERDTIARPFAEFATKNKYMRSHGRQVVALTDSAESIVTLGIFIHRVNRVAKRYKPLEVKNVKRPQTPKVREAPYYGDNGQDQGTGGISGTLNGRIQGDYNIFNPGGG